MYFQRFEWFFDSSRNEFSLSEINCIHKRTNKYTWTRSKRKIFKIIWSCCQDVVLCTYVFEASDFRRNSYFIPLTPSRFSVELFYQNESVSSVLRNSSFLDRIQNPRRFYRAMAVALLKSKRCLGGLGSAIPLYQRQPSLSPGRSLYNTSWAASYPFS